MHLKMRGKHRPTLALAIAILLATSLGTAAGEAHGATAFLVRLFDALGLKVLGPDQESLAKADQSGPHRDLFVVGAGFGRMGTSSLQMALIQLGFGHTYHMKEVFMNNHPELWGSDLRKSDKLCQPSVAAS